MSTMYEKCMHRVDTFKGVQYSNNTVGRLRTLHVCVCVDCVTSVCDCAMAPSGRIKLVDPHFSISLIYFNDMNIVSLHP